MDDDVALYELLNSLASTAEKYAPDIARDLKAITAAFEGAKEVNSTGGLTRKAHQWLQRLRNPFFMTTHEKAAKQANNRLVKKAHAAFILNLQQTVMAMGHYRQALLEQNILKDAECGPPSREGIPAKDWEDLQRFSRAMTERNVPLYVFGRLRANEFDLIAKLAADAHRDPSYEEPNNIWNAAFQGGILDAYRNNMSEEQRLLLEEAAAKRDEPESLALRDALEARLGRRLNVTPLFAAACEELSLKLEEWTTTGAANALYAAKAGGWSKQTDWICKILSVPIDQKAQVEAFVGFLVSGMRENRHRDSCWDYLRYNLEVFTKDFETRHIPPAGWLPGLAQVFGIDNEFKALKFKDPAAFWALYEFVLRNSDTYFRLNQEKHEASENEHRKFWQAECEYLDKMGVTYRLDENGLPLFDQTLDDEEDGEVNELSVPEVIEGGDPPVLDPPSDDMSGGTDLAVTPVAIFIDRISSEVFFGDILAPQPPVMNKYGDLE
ncbi:hypothetical protein [Sphingorhabdus sp.]|jgi:hypothetical protein|uniref:hypothetical protein n=1 Tax=Sphingorhabdus sp. TaxID=1902408 RepID=UPI003D81BEB8